MSAAQKLIEAAEALLSDYEASPCPMPHLIAQVRSAVRGLREAGEPVVWYDGPPPFPQDQEWFIAETIHGDRVVLRALEESSKRKGNYAFKTADETYVKEGVVKRWMQFPDCEYLPPSPAPQPEPMFWVRLRSDGGYEGPLHNDSIEQTRKQSGAWHPLFLGAAPQPAQDGGEVVEALRWKGERAAFEVFMASGEGPSDPGQLAWLAWQTRAAADAQKAPEGGK